VIPTIPGVVLAEEIGAGGFATVYRGTQTVIGRDVAVKLDTRRLTADRDRRRFEREVQAAGMVAAHPNIVSLYDAGITEDSRPYLVMELCTGGSYGQRIKRSGPVPLQECIEVGIAIADALAAAHDQGILHRDVKPGNILISQYGAPMLADFGLAVLPRPGFDVSVTLESLTPAYSAPETFALKPPTASADIFGLGTTLYAMLQGRAPHSDPSGQPPSLPKLLYLLNEPLPPLVGYPAADRLMQIIWRATAAEPENRYFSAAAMRNALRELRDAPAVGWGTPVRPDRPGHPVPPAPPGHTSTPGRPPAPGGSHTGDFTMFNALLDHSGSSAGPAATPSGAGPARQLLAAGHARPPSADNTADRRRGRRRGALIAAAVAAVLLGGSALYVIPKLNPANGVADPGRAVDVVGTTTDGSTAGSLDPTTTRDSTVTTATESTAEVTEPPTSSGPIFPAAVVGQCFGGILDAGDSRTAAALDSCDQPHYYEVFAVGTLDDDTASPLMSDVAMDKSVKKVCNDKALRSYLDGKKTDGLSIEVLPPREALFYQGEKSFRCLATKVGAGQVTGHLSGGSS